jgi:hypothetical protein
MIGVLDVLWAVEFETGVGEAVGLEEYVDPDTATPTFPRAVGCVVVAGGAVAEEACVVLAATPSVDKVIVVVGAFGLSSGHPDRSQTFDAEQQPLNPLLEHV